MEHSAKQSADSFRRFVIFGEDRRKEQIFDLVAFPVLLTVAYWMVTGAGFWPFLLMCIPFVTAALITKIQDKKRQGSGTVEKKQDVGKEQDV